MKLNKTSAQQPWTSEWVLHENGKLQKDEAMECY
jgi:hypothetical protein